MEPKFQSLIKLFEDADTAKKLLAYTPEEAVTFLKDQYQLEFTSEELVEVAQGIKAAIEDTSDELSPDQLEDVVGGGKGSGAYNAGYYIGKVVKVAGTIIGIVAAATGTW